MVDVPGKNTRILIAQYDVSGQYRAWEVARQRTMLHTTPLRQDDKRYLAGLGEATLTLDGFFSSGVGESDVLVDAAMDGEPLVVTVSPEGATAIGQRAQLLHARQEGAPFSADVESYVKLVTNRRADGAAAGGVVLKEFDAETSTGNLASVDNAASSAFGAVGHLHVTAFTGTSATIRITDSTDNSIFADLIVFTAVTAPTSQRLTAVGTVDRYARVQITGTFSSVTFAVGLARLTQ